ncbi:nucleoside transporter family [Alternaria alternata]|nr:nucleoside transporter family [Alternaria alternata]
MCSPSGRSDPPCSGSYAADEFSRSNICRTRSMIAGVVAFEVCSGMYCGVADITVHVYKQGTSLRAIVGLYG